MAATTVTFNGTNYNVPGNGDSRTWGPSLTAYLIALSTGTLSKSGGAFSLISDANFGASKGLISLYYKSYTSNLAGNIATSGVVRLGNLEEVVWRNAANNANLALTVSASDRLNFGAVNIPTISSTDNLTNKTLTSPTLVTPALGNVASGNIANTTGYAMGSLTGLGTNVASFLGTPSSANLAGALTDKTGTGVNVFATAPTLDKPVINQADVTQGASATTPAAGRSAIYVNSGDAKLHVVDSSGNDVAVGSGSSGRNFMGDWYDSAKDIGTVTNSLGDTPSSSDRTANKTTWGSSNTSLLTIARSTNSELRQTFNYLITEAGSSSGAFIESPLFTLDQVDIGKPVSVSFDVKGNAADGDYQTYIVRYNASNILQSRVVIAGNASTTSPNSAKLPTGTTTFNGFFVPDTTSTDHQYALRIVSNNSSAASLRIDTLFIGPQPIRVGSPNTGSIPWTPTFTGFGTPTGVSFSYVRNGEFLEAIGFFTSGTVTAATAAISLPTGLTSSMGTTAGDHFAVGRWDRDTATASQVRNGLLVVPNTASATIVNFTYSDYNAAASPFTLQLANNIIGSSQKVEVSFKVRINEWASNVTMADRSVEEYSSNSNTADASDSTSFVYGPGGSSTPGALTGTQTKRVRFTTPILPTDTLILEFMNSSVSTNVWQPVHTNYWGTFHYQQQLTAAYGCYHRQVNATDVDVYFSASAQTGSGVYGAAGTSWASITNTRWRLRKISAGAQVGYPISSANLIGRPDNSSPATGYIGETVTLASTAQAGGAGSWSANTTPMATLQPGSWLILGQATAALTTVAQAVAISTSTSAGSGIITQCNMTPNSSINVQMQMQVVVQRVASGSTQALYMHCFNSSGTATGTVAGIAIRIA